MKGAGVEEDERTRRQIVGSVCYFEGMKAVICYLLGIKGSTLKRRRVSLITAASILSESRGYTAL